jgi:hypothetical protein
MTFLRCSPDALQHVSNHLSIFMSYGLSNHPSLPARARIKPSLLDLSFPCSPHPYPDRGREGVARKKMEPIVEGAPSMTA